MINNKKTTVDSVGDTLFRVASALSEGDAGNTIRYAEARDLLSSVVDPMPPNLRINNQKIREHLSFMRRTFASLASGTADPGASDRLLERINVARSIVFGPLDEDVPVETLDIYIRDALSYSRLIAQPDSDGAYDLMSRLQDFSTYKSRVPLTTPLGGHAVATLPIMAKTTYRLDSTSISRLTDRTGRPLISSVGGYYIVNKQVVLAIPGNTDESEIDPWVNEVRADLFSRVKVSFVCLGRFRIKCSSLLYFWLMPEHQWQIIGPFRSSWIGFPFEIPKNTPEEIPQNKKEEYIQKLIEVVPYFVKKDPHVRGKRTVAEIFDLLVPGEFINGERVAPVSFVKSSAPQETKIEVNQSGTSVPEKSAPSSKLLAQARACMEDRLTRRCAPLRGDLQGVDYDLDIQRRIIARATRDNSSGVVEKAQKEIARIQKQVQADHKKYTAAINQLRIVYQKAFAQEPAVALRHVQEETLDQWFDAVERAANWSLDT